MNMLLSVLPIDRIAHVFERIPTALLTFLFCALIVRLLQWALELTLRASRITKAMQGIILQGFSAFLWIGVLALVLESLGLNQLAIALSGSVAIIGIGVASGANKVVSDVIAGLFLAKNRDFKSCEQVKVGDITGRIHSLDARKVRILGKDGTLYIIPNGTFDENTWTLLPKSDKED
jgi:small-conductance mechanosensitive channel